MLCHASMYAQVAIDTSTLSKKDSMLATQKKILENKKKERDSIYAVQREQRKIERENARAFEKKQKERSRAIDSISRAREEAAHARKAYLKYIKSKAYKEKLAKERSISPDSTSRTATSTTSLYSTQEKRGRNESKLENQTNYFQYKMLRLPPEKHNSYLGMQFGHSNYIGDLGGNSGIGNGALKDLSFKENTFMYGFSYAYLYKEALGLRISYCFGSVAGSDENTYYQGTKDPAFSRYLRNLDFKTKINEGSLQIEVHPLKFFSYKKHIYQSYFQPYFFAGIGLFHFNPQGSYYDKIIGEELWVDLHPLRTEGQGMAEYPDRKMYSLTQFNIPHGFGLKYDISTSVSVGIEYMGRLLFTDYLDDVSTTFIKPTLFDKYLQGDDREIAKLINNKSSLIDAGKAYQAGEQRGSPGNKDFYYSVSARLIIKLNRIKQPSIRYPKIIKYDDSEICY